MAIYRNGLVDDTTDLQGTLDRLIMGTITADRGMSDTNRRARFRSLAKAGRKPPAVELSTSGHRPAGVNLVPPRT